MSLPDTFYVALCMTVLILGVVYWFWTQNEYMRRKMNLLENIVYELKTTLNSIPAGGPMTVDGVGRGGAVAEEAEAGAGAEAEAVVGDLKPAVYPPAPSSVLGDDEDLLHEELSDEVAAIPSAMPESDIVEADKLDEMLDMDMSGVDDLLQPGGVGSGIKEIPIAADSTNSASVLDSMTLKELKRLAEQRGIHITNSMRKQQLIDAIRGSAL